MKREIIISIIIIVILILNIGCIEDEKDKNTSKIYSISVKYIQASFGLLKINYNNSVEHITFIRDLLIAEYYILVSIDNNRYGKYLPLKQEIRADDTTTLYVQEINDDYRLIMPEIMYNYWYSITFEIVIHSTSDYIKDIEIIPNNRMEGRFKVNEGKVDEIVIESNDFYIENNEEIIIDENIRFIVWGNRKITYYE